MNMRFCGNSFVPQVDMAIVRIRQSASSGLDHEVR